MPRALAIETSGRIGSVAVAVDGRVLAEESFPHGLQHAARIISVIDGLCRGQGWAAGDLQEIYVSAGAGSFTGLRIGITVAKGLALATEVKLAAVPSVRVLAENAPAEATDLILVLDAKRGQIFTAAFSRRNEEWIEREPAHLDDLSSILQRSPRPVWLLGEGIAYHRQSIPPNDAEIHLTDENLWRARASAVVKIGYGLARQGQWADPFKLTPIYIRRPEAEEKSG